MPRALERRYTHMKITTVPLGSMLLGVLLVAAPLCAEEQVTLKTGIDKDSYRTGVDIVRSLKQRGGQIDLDLVIRGMKDGLTGENMLLSDDELRKDLAARAPESAEKHTQAASQQDTTHPTSADVVPDNKAAASQTQINPERADDPVPSNAAFAKKETQAQKTGQFMPFTQSVAQRGQDRNALKVRALELRRQAIEKGL
jgi:hypothetical protein